MKTIRTTTRPIHLPEHNDPKDPSMVRFYCDQCGHHHGEPNNQWPPCGAVKYSNPGPGIQRCQCTHTETPPTP